MAVLQRRCRRSSSVASRTYRRNPSSGQIYAGTVSGVKDFGLFVKIMNEVNRKYGFESMVHISEITANAWRKIADAGYKEGDKSICKISGRRQAWQDHVCSMVWYRPEDRCRVKGGSVICMWRRLRRHTLRRGREMDMESFMEQARVLQDRVSAAQDLLDKYNCSRIADAGACIVTMTGKYDLVDIKVELKKAMHWPAAMLPPVVAISERFCAAFRDAKAKADAAIDKIMGDATAGIADAGIMI